MVLDLQLIINFRVTLRSPTHGQSHGTLRRLPPTCSDHLLNLDTGDVNFLGKLPHCLIRVLVGERVNIDLHAWGHWGTRPGWVTWAGSRGAHMGKGQAGPPRPRESMLLYGPLLSSPDPSRSHRVDGQQVERWRSGKCQIGSSLVLRSQITNSFLEQLKDFGID